MGVKLQIGRNSNGEDVSVLLKQEPNIFISYSDDEQLYFTFRFFMKQLHGTGNVKIAYAVAEKTEQQMLADINEALFSQRFIRNDYRAGYIKSKSEFWKSLLKEFRKRLKKTQIQESGQDWKGNTLIVLIDNIFDMILSQNKKTGMTFLELAAFGSKVGIHFVVATYGTYRNLLAQLIQLHPTVAEKLRDNSRLASLTMMNPLGSELILSAEGLKFYKEKESLQLVRLYPEPGYPASL